ncbi:MAG: integrase arm-type DNA-binding domain-containing protein [Rhizobiales bacterium]|nr:integrase arm-type DNA-binding domain-containing protein [Hyphomicrobiales bacterium]
MAKLTKRYVDALSAGEPDYFVWDDDISGFGIRVWPSGKKNFVAQYRAGGRTRRVKIGNYGALTVEEARKQAKIVLGDVARGEDPAEDKATRRKSLTVSDLCDNYLEAAERGLIMGKRGLPKKASTLVTDRSRIDRHIKPLLGTRLAIDITQSDVSRFVRDVTVGKTSLVAKTKKLRGKSVVEGGAGAASRTAGLLGSIFSFAISENIRPDNPVRGVKLQADKQRDRRLTAAEYKALGSTLTDTAEIEPPQAIAAIWLLALTGCRRGEIEALKWSEVDKPGSCFRLADSKEGASVRPVGRPAFDVLDGLSSDGRFVLPAGRGETGFYGGLPGAIKRIMKAAGLNEVTAHTLRHSYASVAGDLGYSDNTIGALLGHAGTTITSRYVHRLDTVLVAAANKVAGEVWRQMTGKGGKVIELPGRASA